MQIYQIFFMAATFVIFAYSPVEAKFIANEKTTYYSVTGNSGRAIKKSIMRHRKIGSARFNQIGLTRTKMDVENILWEYKSGRCSVKRADVVVDIEYILPRWQVVKSSSLKLKKNWQKFSSAVNSHEKTHGKIWKNVYSMMHRDIQKISFKGRKDCLKVKSNIQRILRVAEKNGDNRNNAFERNEKKITSVISRAFLNVVATK